MPKVRDKSRDPKTPKSNNSPRNHVKILLEIEFGIVALL
jgi:hypothetical protein